MIASLSCCFFLYGSSVIDSSVNIRPLKSESVGRGETDSEFTTTGAAFSKNPENYEEIHNLVGSKPCRDYDRHQWIVDSFVLM